MRIFKRKLYDKLLDWKTNRKGKTAVMIEGAKRHASLDAFCQKFSSRVLQRYLIYTKDLQKDEQTLFLPVYLTQFL